MSLSGILTLVVLGVIAGTSLYYKDDIKRAFADKRTDAEKDYDFERKKKEDTEWDSSGWNPDNWFGNNNKSGSNTKQIPKYTPFKQIEVIDPTTGKPTITVIPNTGNYGKSGNKTPARWY